MNRLAGWLLAGSLCGCSLIYERPRGDGPGGIIDAAGTDGARELDAASGKDGPTGQPVASFVIDHEENSLEEYDELVGETLMVDPEAGLNGTNYGLKCGVVPGLESYGIKFFPEEGDNSYAYEFSLDPSSMVMANGDIFRIVQVQSGTSPRSYVALLHFDGQFKVYTFVVTDDDEHLGEGPLDLSPGPQTLTVEVRASSSPSTNDGTLRVTLDGDTTDVSGIALFDLEPPDRILIGGVMGIDSETSGSLYLDEILFWD